MKLIIVSRSLLLKFLQSYAYIIIYYANRDDLTSFPLYPFNFPLSPIAPVSTWHITLKRSEESRQLYLILILMELLWVFLYIEMTLAMGCHT